jgi:hypothetical protein
MRWLCGLPWRDSRLVVALVDRGNAHQVLQESNHLRLARLRDG